MNRNTTRIHNKFEFWSVADCDCKWCQFYRKNRPCPLDVCCCADIREEAIRREQAASNSHTGGVIVSGTIMITADESDTNDTFISNDASTFNINEISAIFGEGGVA